MDVALTVEQLWQPVPGGSGSYIRELVAALPAAGARPRGVAARGDGDAGLGIPVAHSPLPRRALYEAWSRARRPRADGRVRADVVHATTWAVPGHRAPLVVTVHDLAFLREPGHFTARGNQFFRRALAITRDEAARVVVPSVATRDDCVEAGIEAGRVDVVPHGVRALPVTEADRAAWRARYGVHRPYVLWCGTLEPRKNLPGLVEAYARAAAGAAEFPDLVLVGPAGWGDTAEAVDRALAALPAGAVHLLGRLPEADLHAAYAGATAFAFPSLWEGFGMPVLEAMAHGVPVVTSAGSSMAEFAGDAGVLADPADPDALAAALTSAVTEDRSARSAAALRVAGDMTWAASAAAHVATYRAAGAT
ncbi:glycosyltransferase family 4 protein [Cellulomonas sp. Marseille-Q8402]